MLVFLKLLAEAMAELKVHHPGCLVASFSYESYQLDDEVKSLIAESTLRWRDRSRTQLEMVEEQYPAKLDVSLDELADMLTGIIEGGIFLSRVLNDKMALVQQIRQYRNYIKLLFAA